ncbi:MAG: 16S rRNA (cytosine(1402)-N(4))-methyltransferase RsmH [Phycisphaerae bacterium]|nr:16S rRNA (cytosine(1402)-N(4))-methyltransferase RsmH [Phycisphaerae bacterium]
MAIEHCDPSKHVPVMPRQVISALSPCQGNVYLDCTAGLGGHAALIAPILEPGGTVALCDLDSSNLDRAARAVRSAAPTVRIETLQGSYARAPDWLCGLGLEADVVLADLGFASTQVDDPARGFSFRHNGPLDMRLDPTSSTTAADLVRSLPERDLADLIYRWGEDRLSRRIARRIVAERRLEPISSTARLAEIVASAYGPRAGHSRIHPATRTFQALRIAVNDEIGALDALLQRIVRAARQPGAASWLAPDARIAVLSFHSLEDRPVKQAFQELAGSDLAQKLTKKAQRADPEEEARNPRSRSAKLRAVRLLSPRPRTVDR